MYGKSPTLTSGVPKVASSDAIARSHASRTPMPPARQCPLTLATMGRPQPHMALNRSGKRPWSSQRASGGAGPPAMEPLRSAPAQKALSPAPVSTTALTSGSSRTRPNAAINPARVSGSRELRFSGRLIVMVATPSSTSNCTLSLIGSSAWWRSLHPRRGPPLDALPVEHVVLLRAVSTNQVKPTG